VTRRRVARAVQRYEEEEEKEQIDEQNEHEKEKQGIRKNSSTVVGTKPCVPSPLRLKGTGICGMRGVADKQ
jgi:hypothetical protein